MTQHLTPSRHLDVDGAYNIRDLGGYPTADGRKTRWRTFLRADSLHRLTAESQQALVDYGVRGIPEKFLIDAQRQMIAKFVGSSDVDGLRETLDQMLAGQD